MCRVRRPLQPDDIRFACLALIGRIENYEIIRDAAFRRSMLQSEIVSIIGKNVYEDSRKTLLCDYAKLDISVDQVLLGQAENRMTATWFNSTFGLPRSVSDSLLLMAFRSPSAKGPPKQGPGATFFSPKEPELLTVLQAPCAPAFLLPVDGEAARTVRDRLGGFA
jgi:hypothetical protein